MPFTKFKMNIIKISIPKKDGLSDEEVKESIEKYGNNSLVLEQDSVLLDVFKGIVSEPMYIILLWGKKRRYYVIDLLGSMT